MSNAYKRVNGLLLFLWNLSSLAEGGAMANSERRDSQGLLVLGCLIPELRGTLTG